MARTGGDRSEDPVAQTGAGSLERLVSDKEFFPVISTFSGEYRDPAVEALFQESIRTKTVRQLRLVSIPAAACFVLGIFVDVLVLGHNPVVLGTIVAGRMIVAGVILAAMVLADKSSFTGRSLDRLIVVPVMTVSVATWAIVPAIRGELLLHALTALVLILVYYLFVPLRLISVLTTGLIFSTGFVLSVAIFLDLRPDEFIQVVLYLTLANVLGALVNRDRHTAVRREYGVVQLERQATDELREEIKRTAAAEAELAESESRFRSLVELSPDAILVHREGIVLYLNPAGIRLMGAKESTDLIGRSFFDFLLPDSRQLVSGRIGQLERGATELPPAELKVRTFDGRDVDCEVVSGPVVFEGKPSIQSVVRDINERKRLREELTRLATTDPLTGVCNRRSFFDRLEKEWSRARRYTRPLSILMFDLDFFKSINDNHGHAVGDTVLIALVKEAVDILRSDDIIARLGGEEFAILLPEIDLEGASAVAERLRERLAGVEVEAPDSVIRCTVSVGVAQGQLAKESPDVALKRADDALYKAKRAGRNQVCVG